MYVAFIITNSDCYVPHFVHVKMKVVLMIIRGDPAHPDATGLLTRKHSHRIVVLVKAGDSMYFNTKKTLERFIFFPSIYLIFL